MLGFGFVFYLVEQFFSPISVCFFIEDVGGTIDKVTSHNYIVVSTAWHTPLVAYRMFILNIYFVLYHNGSL